MAQRFEYERMTAEEFAADLEEIGVPPKAFARIFGVNWNTVVKWLKGENDVPAWVFVAIALLREAPNAMGIARTAAANHIRFDKNRPELGEYPYLNREEDMKDDDDERL